MLASDLKEYGKGYFIDQLKRMARFASYFNENEISAQAVHQIPWSTIIELMRLSSSKEKSLMLEQSTLQKQKEITTMAVGWLLLSF